MRQPVAAARRTVGITVPSFSRDVRTATRRFRRRSRKADFVGRRWRSFGQEPTIGIFKTIGQRYFIYFYIKILVLSC